MNLKINLILVSILSTLVACSTRPKTEYVIQEPEQGQQLEIDPPDFVDENGEEPVDPNAVSKSDLDAVYLYIQNLFTQLSEQITALNNPPVVIPECPPPPTTATVNMIDIYHYMSTDGYYDSGYSPEGNHEYPGYILVKASPDFQLFRSATDAAAKGCVSGVNAVYQCRQHNTYKRSGAYTSPLVQVDIAGYPDRQHYITIAPCAATDTPEDLGGIAPNGLLGYNCKYNEVEGLSALYNWAVGISGTWYGPTSPGQRYAVILNAYTVLLDANYLSGWKYSISLGFAPTNW